MVFRDLSVSFGEQGFIITNSLPTSDVKSY